MRALEGEAAGLSLGQIALHVGLARSTVQRIVGALEQENLLIAASPTGRVRLGPTLLRLAGSVETDLVSLARPLLVDLSTRLRETVDLAAVERDQAVFIDQVTGPQRLRAVSAVGDAFPLYCTANGKAYLARLDDAAVRRLLGSALPARTPHTITRMSSLLADLARIRKTGIAFDREEHTEGIAAAGIALREPAGSYVAISVPVPAQRFEVEAGTIARELLATKKLLLSRLNGT